MAVEVAVAESRRNYAFAVVICATFMTYLDSNIINVALSSMEHEMQLSLAALEWIVSSYVLVFGTFLLVCGRLADFYGSRPILLGGLVVFTAASMVAGTASGPAVLIASRAVQGLGAAAVTPTTLAVISSMYKSDRKRHVAMGIWNAAGALGVALGPLLGGLLSQYANWKWIFFINVPIGVITVAVGASSLVLPSSIRDASSEDAAEGRQVRARIDMGGLLSSGCSLFLLIYALIQAGANGWASPVTVGCLVLAGLLGAVFVLIEHRVADPMIVFSWFRTRVFGGGMITGFMWGFGIYGTYFYTSLYAQDVLGFSPTVTGAAFVPMALLIIVGSILSESAARRAGAHRSVAAAMLVIAAGMSAALQLGLHATFFHVTMVLVIIGVGAGFTTSLTARVLGAMPASRAGVASAVFNTVRQLGVLLGVTVIGTVLSARMSAASRAGQSATAAYLKAFDDGLVIAAVLMCVGGAAAWAALRAVRRPGRHRA